MTPPVRRRACWRSNDDVAKHNIGCVSLAAIACGGGSDPADDTPPSYTTVGVDFTLVPETDLDILLLVDNSLSVLEMQQKLVDALPAFLDGLSPGGELPNLHIGVATSDLGTMGVETGDAACPNPGDGGALQTNGCLGLDDPYVIDISDGAGGRTRNYSPSLTEILGCIIDVGTSGCGWEQHLEASRMALDSAVNPGFVRPNAQLAVVILADEDDCSVADAGFFAPETTELGPFASFRCFDFGVTCDQTDPRAVGTHTGCRAREDSPYLHGVRPYVDHFESLRPGRVTVGVIAGNNSPVEVGRQTGGGEERPDLIPSCSWTTASGTSSADPGVRLFEFAGSFAERGTAINLCADLAGPVAALGTMMRDRLQGQPCLRAAPRDLDAELDGLQPSCDVTRVGIDQPASPFAACDETASNPPCWRLVEDAAQCGATTPYRLDAVGLTPTYGEHIQARCEVQQ